MSIASMKSEIIALEAQVSGLKNSLGYANDQVGSLGNSLTLSNTARDVANEQLVAQEAARNGERAKLTKRATDAEMRITLLKADCMRIDKAANSDIGTLKNNLKIANDKAASWERQSNAMNVRRKELERMNKQQYDKIVDLTGDNRVSDSASRSIANLFRIDIAELNVRLARQQAETAEALSSYWKARSAIAGWESRTGKDHRELLKGDYAQPFGTEGPGK